MKFRKRFYAAILTLVLACSTTMFSYTEARASSAAIGGTAVVTAEYAIAYLLGLLGITAASAVVYDNADDLKAWGADRLHDFENFCEENVANYNEWANATSDKVNNAIDSWWNSLCKGTIKKGSVVWQAFKDWVGSIYLNPSGGAGSSSGSVVDVSTSFSDYLDVPVYYGLPSSLSDKFDAAYSYALSDSRIVNSSSGFILVFTGDRLSLYYDISSADLFSSVSSYLGDHVYITAPYFKAYNNGASYGFQGESTRSQDVSSGLYYTGTIPWTYNGEPISITDVDQDDPYVVVPDLPVGNAWDRDQSLDNVDVIVPGIVGVTDVPIDWTGVGTSEDEQTDSIAGVVAGDIPWENLFDALGVDVIDKTVATDIPTVTDFPWLNTLIGWLSDILSAIKAIPGSITSFFVIDLAAVTTAFAGIKEAFASRFPLLDGLAPLFNYSGGKYDTTPPVFTIRVPDCLKFAYPNTNEIVILDLTLYAEYFAMARTIIAAGIWLLFAQWVLREFDIKFHIG